MQSDYGEKGYFDVVGRVNDHLVHFFREDFAPFHWKGPFYVPNSGGSSGNPALVQGNFLGSDKAHKNFELVVPRLDSGFNHYWVERKVEINFVTMPIPGMGSFYNINIPIPKLKYQWHGPFPIAVDRGKIDAISLIQSNFKSGFNTPGNLDVIARQGDHLVYFWREDYSPFAWHGPFNIPNSTESTGNPSFVQSNFGDIRHGNYELVVPRVDGGFNFFWKDSNLKLTTIRPGLEAYRPFYEDNSTWHGPYVVGAGKGKVNAISIIQSTFSSTGKNGNLEVAACLTDNNLVHYWREDTPPLAWHGPFRIGECNSHTVPSINHYPTADPINVETNLNIPIGIPLKGNDPDSGRYMELFHNR